MKRTATVLVVSMLAYGCAGPFELRKTQWTLPEVKSWYVNYREDPRAWDGILYQGSDLKWHYYVARVISVDNWAIIKIRREDLSVAEERPHSSSSGAALGYYFVDPTRDFVKLRDYRDTSRPNDSLEPTR
jgi:hypothetical protein